MAGLWSTRSVWGLSWEDVKAEGDPASGTELIWGWCQCHVIFTIAWGLVLAAGWNFSLGVEPEYLHMISSYNFSLCGLVWVFSKNCGYVPSTGPKTVRWDVWPFYNLAPKSVGRGNMPGRVNGTWALPLNEWHINVWDQLGMWLFFDCHC